MAMDATETGAYLMLILAHYQAGIQGLPNDDVFLSRAAKVSTKVWRTIRPRLQRKFDITNDFWIQKRVVQELRKIDDIRAANSAKALKQQEARRATALPKHSLTNNQYPIAIKPDKKEPPIVPLKGEDGFDTFWISYPAQRKGNKQKALSAYRRALTRTTQEKINAGLQAYVASSEVANGYASGAERWLNNDGWTADYSNRPARAGSGNGYSIENVMQKALSDKTGDFKRGSDGLPIIDFLDS